MSVPIYVLPLFFTLNHNYFLQKESIMAWLARSARNILNICNICHLKCSQHTHWIHTNMNAWKIKSTYMSSHRHPSDTKRSQPVAFTPVKQNQRLQNKATTHHKDVWHIVQTWTAFKRYKSKKCLSPLTERCTSILSTLIQRNAFSIDHNWTFREPCIMLY